MDKKLADLRKEIDAVDKDLLASLAKRAKIAQRIGKLKKAQGVPPLDEKRWQQLLDKILHLAGTMDLSRDFVKKIYELIHNHSLELERKSE